MTLRANVINICVFYISFNFHFNLFEIFYEMKFASFLINTVLCKFQNLIIIVLSDKVLECFTISDYRLA